MVNDKTIYYNVVSSIWLTLTIEKKNFDCFLSHTKKRTNNVVFQLKKIIKKMRNSVNEKKMGKRESSKLASCE